MNRASATSAPPPAPPPGWALFGAAVAVAAGLHAVWMAYDTSSDLGALLHDFDPTFGRPVPAPMRAALFAAKEVARQQALLAVCATVVSIALAAWLMVIGLGIRRGALAHLRRVRTWVMAAVVVDLLWLGMRVALVPAQRRAIELLRAAVPSGSPFGTQLIEDVGTTMVSWPLLAKAAAQLVGPVVVSIWAGLLLRGVRLRESAPSGLPAAPRAPPVGKKKRRR